VTSTKTIRGWLYHENGDGNSNLQRIGGVLIIGGGLGVIGVAEFVDRSGLYWAPIPSGCVLTMFLLGCLAMVWEERRKRRDRRQALSATKNEGNEGKVASDNA